MNLMRSAAAGLLAGLCLLPAFVSAAEEPFAKKVGEVKVADVKAADQYDVPFFTWGGDVATFLANGGKGETKKDTLFDKQKLKLNLVPGDDFVAQVKNYLEGKTPYLRGTISQLGQASEVLGKDPRTRPVVFLQLTWSAGDHLVVRPTVKTANDLKGKKIALQYGGPHVGMLDDVLRAPGVKWDDIKVVWTNDVTGKDGPADLFRKDPSVDACFVITPDMVELTGGAGKTGDGSEKTVKGATVLISTTTLSHSIADVYACRKDFFDKNQETIEKFTAAYLKACEDLVEMKKNYDAKDKDKALLEKYKALLKTTQDIYGKDVIPDADAAHGLISDANFVALPGNWSFFKDEKNAVNFKNRQDAAVALAVERGYAKERINLTAASFDYDKIKERGGLKLNVPKEGTASVDKFKKIGEDTDFNLDKDTLYFFAVQFDPDDANFDIKKYEKDFQKAIDEAALYGNALFKIRGHVDPTRTLRLFVNAGLEKRLITREKKGDETKYYTAKDGKEFLLSDTKRVVKLINEADFTGATENPKPTLEAAEKLSKARAKRVLDELTKLAKAKGVQLDVSQFRSEGVGIVEPIIPVPRSLEQAAKNRRVEFRILRVSPEKLTAKDFND